MSNLMGWSHERIAKVADLLIEGLSASQIGQELDVSRNAVIGIVHRSRYLKSIGFARVAGGRDGGTVPGQSARAPKSVSVSGTSRHRTIRGGKLSLNRMKPPPVSTPLPSPEPIAPRVQLEPRNLRLMQLTARTCKWPVNDPPRGVNGHLFCGHKTTPGKSWCAYHCERAFGDGTRSERSASRSLMVAA